MNRRNQNINKDSVVTGDINIKGNRAKLKIENKMEKASSSKRSHSPSDKKEKRRKPNVVDDELNEEKEDKNDATSLETKDEKLPTRGKLRPENEKLLRKEYEYLLSELDGKHLTAYLFSKSVIDLDTQTEICNEKSRELRTRKLLDTVFQCGPGEAFPEFLNALEKDYSHVAERLRNKC